MNLMASAVIGLILTIAAIAAFCFLTAPFPVIFEAKNQLVLLSVSLYALSILVWNLVYLFLLYVLKRNLQGTKTFFISVFSLVGFLTPANIGTDVLRAIFNKQMIRLNYEETLTACIQTRTFKLRVILLLAVPLLPFLPILPGDTLFFLLMSMLLILLLLLSFSYASHGRVKKISSMLGVGELSTYTREVTTKLTLRESTSIYSGFIVAFAMEVFSLQACFLSLGLRISVPNVLALFAVLYFLSRLPFLPQGVIVVETVGFIVLIHLNFTVQQTGAVLILWDFVRLVTPVVLSIACSLPILKDLSVRIERDKYQTCLESRKEHVRF